MIVENDEDDIPLKIQDKAVPPPAPPTQRPRKTPQNSNLEQQHQPLPSTSSSAKAKAVPATNVKPKKPAKRPTPTFTDDETLESARPAKRSRASPAQPPPPPPEPKRGPSPSRLELPGMSSAFVQPLPIPPSMAKPTTSSSLSSRAQPIVAQQSLESLSPLPPSADSDSEDEDEWEQIAAPISHPSVPMPVVPAAEEEAGEEIDVDALEDLMNAQMNEADDDEPEPEDDFLAMALPEEQPTPVLSRGPPISLKQFAGGDSADEDDSSSSDDSDED